MSETTTKNQALVRAISTAIDNLYADPHRHPYVQLTETTAQTIREALEDCASLQAELSACREQLDEALQSAMREVARLETEAMERQSELAQTKRDLAVSQETVRLLQEPHWCQRASDAEAELERVRQERNDEHDRFLVEHGLRRVYEADKERLQSDLAALKAAQAWRPISEAPDDGSTVVVYDASYSQPVVLGFWDRDDANEGGQCWRAADAMWDRLTPTKWTRHVLPAAPPEEK